MNLNLLVRLAACKKGDAENGSNVYYRCMKRACKRRSGRGSNDKAEWVSR
jgi:hypothetical protein